MVGASSRVRLVGLAAKPELNGRLGKVLRFVKEKERWQVHLDGEPKGSSLALKENNLRVIPECADALAETILLARNRADEGKQPLKTVHILGASSFELSLQFGKLAAGREPPPKPAELPKGFLGKWKTEKGNINTIDEERLRWQDEFGSGSSKTGIEDGKIWIILEGEDYSGELADNDQKLCWSDGESWMRVLDEESVTADQVRIALIGPELPETYSEGKLEPAISWPELEVAVSCFRGTYEDFAASSDFFPAEVSVLANPGLEAGGFFIWLPALAALAAQSQTLGICTGREPFNEGEWLGDANYDEKVIRSCGFEVLSSTTRNPHGCICADHPETGWHIWSYTMAFRWPQGQTLPSEDLHKWRWESYYKARRRRCELPRFRFKPLDPEFRPSSLNKLAEEQLASRKEREEIEKNTEDEDEKRELLNDLHKAEEDRQEIGVLARGEWMTRTVSAAWVIGAGQSSTAGAVAGAIAAAEEFAENNDAPGNRPHDASKYVLAMGAAEVAVAEAKIAEGGGSGAAAVTVAAVLLFEALATEVLWPGPGVLKSDRIGEFVVSLLERREVELGTGMASMIGGRVADAHAALSPAIHGQSLPLFGKLEQEFRDLAEAVGESVNLSGDKAERQAVAQAVVDNLDLWRVARGGREAFLRISTKMQSAPPRFK